MKDIKNILGIAFMLLLFSCSEDKGNYQYDEVSAISAENMPTALNLLQRVDNVVLEPVIKSSTEGIITQDNPNFEFGCRLYKKSGNFASGSRWVDINKDKTIAVNHPSNYDVGSYMAWYTVTDKRTGVVTNFSVDVIIKGSTYEGWLVLCNVGAANNVRLDMVTVMTENDKFATIDVLGEQAPKLNNANRIMLDIWPNGFNTDDCLWFSSQSGTYELNRETLQTKPVDDIRNLYFVLDMEGQTVVCAETVPLSYRLAITDRGNLYSQSNAVGSSFGFPVNVFTPDHDPEFRVAPFIGTIPIRSFDFYCTLAVLYDKDNQRFVGWDEGKSGGNVCSVLSSPSPEQTKGMDLLTMVSTNFNNGTVYSVLQANDGARYVCGIKLADTKFSQSYFEPVTASGFSQATQFAFHSQYYYMFYNVDNKVNCYHLSSKTVSESLTFDGEEITMLKFNPFIVEKGSLSNQSPEFIEQQHYLIVGSYKKDATDDNGGILRFYKFDQDTQTLTKVMEYSGFGKIKDVVYRERKK